MILGIDPGSKYTGFAVISDEGGYVTSGVINLSQEKDFKSKLFSLSQQLDDIFNQYKITSFSLEKIFLGKNADSAFKLGHVRGVCLMMAGRHDAHVFEYAAKYVKKVVTGSGASNKQTVQHFVNQFFKIDITKEDESDALALAYCCFSQGGILKSDLGHFRI